MKIILLLAFICVTRVAYCQSDSIKYAEMTATPLLENKGDDKFRIFLNLYSDNKENKMSLQQYQYPIDALNYLAIKGWKLICVFSSTTSYNVEIRHYELEKR